MSWLRKTRSATAASTARSSVAPWAPTRTPAIAEVAPRRADTSAGGSRGGGDLPEDEHTSLAVAFDLRVQDAPTRPA